jgi:hypothetical protein
VCVCVGGGMAGNVPLAKSGEEDLGSHWWQNQDEGAEVKRRGGGVNGSEPV